MEGSVFLSAPAHLRRTHVRDATFVLLLAAFAAVPARTHAASSAYAYVSPAPDSRWVSAQNNIAIRPGGVLDAGAISAGRFTVTGSASGVHSGSVVLADDARTVIFTPDRPFDPGETVRVELAGGMRTAEGTELPPLSFGFSVAPFSSAARRRGALESLSEEVPALAPSRAASHDVAKPAAPLSHVMDLLPTDYPTITVLNSDHPEPGDYFMAPFGPNYLQERGRLMILDHNGLPLFYRSWPQLSWEFKRQPNGLLTFFTQPSQFSATNPARFIAMDSSYAVVDSFEAGNGYNADAHELQLLANGHALLMAYDWEPVDMSVIVPGGDPNALVAGLIIQELDTAKNVVFQWRSWDHFQITDMDTCIGTLRDAEIDYVHGNAVEQDADGNLLLSSRHMNEITKINRQTGAIIWRMGLNAKNNQFSFPNDPRGYSHQHDIRRLANGHVTLFDNGNCFDPLYSRALEYQLDEVNKVATLVWEYRNAPDMVSPFMGNVQRQSDGGTTIDWGGTGPNPKLTDLHADGTKAIEFGVGPGILWSYRGFRFPWLGTALVSGPASLDFGSVAAGHSVVRRVGVTNHLTTPLTINSTYSTDTCFIATSSLPLTLAPGASDSVAVQFTPSFVGVNAGEFYLRAVNDTGLVATVVSVTGTGTGTGVSINDVVAYEGNSGTTPFTFSVSLTGASSDTVTVDYSTCDSTATVSGSDYVATSGKAVIPPGALSTSVTVNVLGDFSYEPDEAFFVQLANPSHALFVRARGMGDIRNDDSPLAVDKPGAPPAAFALHAPEPNPSREGPTLNFDVPRLSHVTLEVFDVRGRRVKTLVDGIVAPGRHAVTWLAHGEPPGVYYSRLRAGEFSATVRFAVVR
jgi:hypothetical protein